MVAVWVIAIAVGSGAILAGSSHFHALKSVGPVAANSQASTNSAEQRGRVRASMDALPLAFEKNQGQTDSQVKYMARGNGYTVFLTGNEAVFALQSSSRSTAAPPSRTAGTKQTRVRDISAPAKEQEAAIEMRLVGGNAEPQVVAGSELPGITNYYIGNNPDLWRTGVKQYSTVSYRDVYPGVNMAFHGEQRQLEFDFIVAPGANAQAIGMEFTGARKLTTDASGNLVLSSSAGDVVLHKPVAYQVKNGSRQLVDAKFLPQGKSEVAIALGSYDRSRELVIDPSLSYATYLGGSAEDDAFAIAVDGSGSTYITGQTKSPTFGGKAAGPNFDVFVTKLNAAGTSLVYTAIFSASGTGSGDCSGNGIAVDGSGDAFVAGSATKGFPTAGTPLQSAFGGGNLDAFVLELNATGTAVIYSTYLGGSGNDIANGIAIDGSGNAYVAGDTFSTDFPTLSAIQSTNKGSDDAFVAKLNTTGSALVYSTYLGGGLADLATGIALDASNNAYISGVTLSSDFPTTGGAFQTSAGGAGDGFVAKVKADGSQGYSTYLGGSGADNAFGIAVDSAGEAYVTGNTNSSNFPTSHNAAQASLKGATDVFVTKLNPTGSGLVFSTYLGGTLEESGVGIALDAFGDAYVTGRTDSSDFPVSGQPFQGSLNGTSDAFVAELSNTGFVVYASFLGGTGDENSLGGLNSNSAIGAITVDSTSSAYVAGNTNSTTGFPVTAGVYQPNYTGGLADGMVAKVSAAPSDFSVAVSPASISTTSGQTTSTITVTVSSVNSSFGQAVALSCGGLPSKAVCHFSSASVTPGSSAVTSSLTIATNGASSASMLAPRTNLMRVYAAMLLPVFGFVIFGATPSRRRKLGGWLAMGVILMALTVLPACGGGSGGGGGGGGGGTTPGNYNITVSGAGGGVNHSAALTLTVN